MKINDWSACLTDVAMAGGEHSVEEATAGAEQEPVRLNHAVLGHEQHITKLIISTKITQGCHQVVRTKVPLKI